MKALFVGTLVLATVATAMRTVPTTLGQDQMMYVCPSSSPLSVSTHPCINGGAVAWGTYNRSSNMTGWNVLNGETNGSHTDSDQSYAAGLIEGYGAAEDMLNFHHNTLGPLGSWGPVISPIMTLLQENDQWMQYPVEWGL